MIKPSRPLLLLVYVAALLAAALAVLPAEYRISRDIALKSFTLKSLFEKKDAGYADITTITAKFSGNLPDSVFTRTSRPKTSAPADSNAVQNSIPDTAQTPAVLEKQYQIRFPANDSTVLDRFFGALQNLPASGQLIRVLHYGDSQIEGDRISSYLRHKLQRRFGGCGVGLVPLVDKLNNRPTLVQRADPEWLKLYAYSNGYQKKHADSYGIMGGVYKYSFLAQVTTQDSTRQTADSLADTVRKPVYTRKGWQNASVSYSESLNAYPLDRQAEFVRILYRNRETPFQLAIEANQDSVYRTKMDTGTQARLYRYRLPQDFRRLKLTFGSSRSPELFGVALDCGKGVAVDNLSFRGSSGVDFTKLSRPLLRQQMQALNVRLIIVQFGVNVVPYIHEDYKFYEDEFYRQLQLLRQSAPEAAVLVVGVSDMSRRESDAYVSYPNVEKIRDAQQNAAFRAGCAFWDLYQAMGGHNSMPSWVAATPALAGKDYTHFTPRGAMLVGEMLYNSLMHAYQHQARAAGGVQ